MLTRLVLKILFKACVPLFAMVGIMSYMMYMNGGDPMALASKVFGGAADQARNSMQQAGQSMKSVGSLATSSDSDSSSSAVSTVHTWVDADGVKHYSNTAPSGVQSSTMRVNPNANVVARTPKPAPKVAAKPDAKSKPVIPGTGGMELPVGLNREELTNFLEQSQRPSVERMMEQ